MLIKDEKCFYHNIEVRFCDCDKNKRMRLETILRNTADVAGIAYTAKGYSHSWLWERGFVFLLSRVAMNIKRTPVSEEKLTIETWENGVKGAIFYRNVAFYDENGNEVIACSTAWTLVNPAARTILKPSAFTGKVDPYPEKPVDCKTAAKIKAEGDFTPCESRKIVYSDIDANNHVYNAVYAGIACDVLPDELIERELREFEINFKQEVILHETLELEQSLVDNTAYVIGKIGNTVSFESKFVF